MTAVRRGAWTTLLVAGSALAARLPAQAPIGKGAWFDWVFVKAVVVPDSAQGVLVWAATIDSAATGSARQDYSDFFDPDSAVAWAGLARRELDNTPAAPADTATWHFGPMLVGRVGVAVVVGRHWVDGKWERDPYLFFQPPAGAPLAVHLFRGAAQRFLAQVSEQAAMGLVAPPNAGLVVVPTAFAPRQVSEKQPLKYPEGLRQSNTIGDVWVSFIVDTDGTVLPESIRSLHADKPGFLEAVRAYLLGVRFAPSHEQDRLARAAVRIPFFFRLKIVPTCC